MQMSQFVWVVEYCSKAQWDSGAIAVRAVLDATASPRDPMPVWLAHNGANAILFDRSSQDSAPLVLSLTATGSTLGRMERNLRHIRPK